MIINFITQSDFVYKKILKMKTQFPLKRTKLISLTFIVFILSLTSLCTGCKKTTNEVNPSQTENSTNDERTSKLGYGFDNTKELLNVSSTRAKVIDVNKLYKEAPNRVVIDMLEDDISDLLAGEDVLDYARVVTLKANLGILGGLFKASADYTDSLAIRADYSYASYNNEIKKKQLKLTASPELLREYLTEEFKQDAITQTPQWLVENYGTCVLTNIVLGGRLEIVYRASTNSLDRKTAASAGLKSSIKSIFDLDINPGLNTSIAQNNKDQKLYYKTTGGNSSLGLYGEINLEPTNSTTIKIGAWHNSVNLDNAQFIGIGGSSGVILLSDLIADPAKSKEVSDYIKQYLIDNQIVVPDAPEQIYEFYGNGRHAYSIMDVPSIHANYMKVGPKFKGYSQAKNGAVPIYEQFNRAKNIWIYTQSSSAEQGCDVNGIAFYAFKTQVPGSVPIYEFYYERVSSGNMYYDNWYSLDQTIPDQDTHYMRTAFYAYP